MFLCACGNGQLLLQCASQEATPTADTSAPPSTDTTAVLRALETYTQTHGFIAAVKP